jgi:hypothetical protein
MDKRPVRPVNQADVTRTAPARPTADVSASKPSVGSSAWKDRRMAMVVIVLTVAVVLFGMWSYFRAQSGSGLIMSDRFQAVTLADGRVLFGKLSYANSEHMRLKEVYYFEEQNDDSSEQQGAASTNASLDKNPTLLKHGTELWSPEDEMIIGKDDIVYWENLKPSGKVIDAIKNYDSRQSQ